MILVDGVTSEVANTARQDEIMTVSKRMFCRDGVTSLDWFSWDRNAGTTTAYGRGVRSDTGTLGRRTLRLNVDVIASRL